MKINYVTGNKRKIIYAQDTLEKFGIEVVQRELDVPEQQGENYLEIAKLKAQDAYSKLGEPLFITDTAWEIPALNGFPGAYMKYINQWFTEQDFLKLMEDKENREIIAIDTIIYIDEYGMRVFQVFLNGVIADKAIANDRLPSQNVIKIDGKYIREYIDSKEEIADEFIVWKDFAEFLNSKR